MQLFFHDVGLKGSSTDFPKTVFGYVSVDDIVEHCPEHLKTAIKTRLQDEFPDGNCNVWGVPAGAHSVIRQLSVGDVMLLIETTGGEGSIPALCQVRGFWKEELLQLSNFLWNSTRFPFVFFFKTQSIHLTWSQFKEDVNYMPNFRPAGNVYRVNEDRFVNFGGVEGYVRSILKNYDLGMYLKNTNYTIKEQSADQEYIEGERYVRESAYFKRNSKLVKDAKDRYGFKCQICNFDFKDVYGPEIGSEYIECHHKNPLSEKDEELKSTLDDVCVVCSNCHRMLHRFKPAMKPEELKARLLRKFNSE